jgi:hypothetical protein
MKIFLVVYLFLPGMALTQTDAPKSTTIPPIPFTTAINSWA